MPSPAAPTSLPDSAIIDKVPKSTESFLNTSEVSSTSDAKTGTTVFHTDTQVRSNVSLQTRPLTYVPIREQSIPDFLAKPVFIYSGLWSTSQVSQTSIYSLATVSSLLASGYNNGYYFNKIQGFNLVRFTACFRMTLNANPFQQGRLIMAFSPCENQAFITRTRFFSLSQMTALPNVEVDCRDGSAILKIPYIAPTAFYDMQSGFFDWGALEVQVFSPLKTGSSGATNVELALAFWMEDVELAAPLVPQMAGPRGRTKRPIIKFVGKEKESEVQTQSGALTRLANGVGAVANSVTSNIPMLSAFSEPVAWLSSIVGSVASVFGWSKPLNNAVSTPIVKQRLLYSANATGQSFAVPLALNHENKVQTTELLTPEVYDEASFDFLKRRYQYVSSINWTTSETSGTNKLTQGISPSKIYENLSTTHNTHTAVMHSHPPFGFVSRYFVYWRGSIKILLKFIKTEFHTGRLQVTFTPSLVLNNAVSISTGTLALREIIDIAGKTEFELVFPYLLNTPWAGYDSISGTLEIVILNPLRAPETAATSVDILVFAGAGDDYMVAGPTRAPTTGFIPQMDSGTPAPPVSVSTISEVIGGYDYTAIENDALAPNKFTIGEAFMSVRQLLLRYNPVRWGSLLTFTNGFEMNPWYVSLSTIDPTTGALTSPAYGFDAMSDILTGYAFARGSVRVYVAAASAQPLVAYLTQNSYTTPLSVASLTGASVYQSGQVTYSASTVSSAVPVQIYDPSEGIAEVAVPYYNGYYFMTLDPTKLSFTGDTYPPIRVGVYENTGSIPNIGRSIGDDFQFGYFIGFYPTLYSYS